MQGTRKRTLPKSLLFVLLSVCILQTTEAQIFKRKKGNTEKQADSTQKKKGKIKPYNKVITKDAQSDVGLFTVHKVDDRHYYEIPDSLFNREMLMVSRISKTATGIGFGGGKINTQVLRWEKKPSKVLLRVVSHTNYAADSLPIHEAVVNSNFEPVLYTFDIKALNKKDSLHPNVVVEIDPLFTKDVKALGMPRFYRERYKISNLDGGRSFIETIKSYPLNIEARHVKTYNAKEAPSNQSLGSISVEINNSMILLPKEPMKRRYFDERVGWFARGQIDYGSDAQKSKTIRYLDRWRLEVKEADLEKFKSGELVEPKKPIIYYIDRATPEKWRPYIKQGIEDWQVAFEAAGFKNAIMAKDPPTKEEDPEWSPEDVRYSVVRYLASPIPNANGPHVSDPRSGEILESDINWYHNVMTLLQNWFFVQTAAINPDAQRMEFKKDIMGRLIRFVSAHEVGHTLGLPHNMGSSVAYPVDSLRSASFTKKYGTAPSIMDYARFNYVAQPGDVGVALMPNIGVYDKHAIKWGYRPIHNTTAEEEKSILNQWILAHANDPMYRFGHQQVGDVVDPSSQTEDLGDDAIKAGQYGIANLKRILPKLMDWTTESGENYDDLKAMYLQVTAQFNRYMGHVANNIGGVYEHYKAAGQDGAVYSHVSRDHQKNCLAFLHQELFRTPDWLIDQTIMEKTEYAGQVDRIRRLQVRSLETILSLPKMARLVENEVINGADAYSLLEMTKDLRNGLWSELRKGQKIDTYRRNLQKAHIERLAFLLTAKAPQRRNVWGGSYSKFTPIEPTQSDIQSVARAELKNLQRDIRRGFPRISDTMSRYHLQDALDRIDRILNPK